MASFLNVWCLRNRRNRLSLPVAAALLFACSVCQSEPTTSTRPNILWISIEDTSPNLPMYGDNTAKTPNLVSFADQGCVYDRAFVTSPVCSPSRSTLITGMYAASLGTQNHRSRVKIPASVHCFPAYLRKAGYYCTNNAKTDYNFEVPPDAWDDNSKHGHWRNRPNPNQPFFAVFNIEATHESTTIMPQKKYEERVKDVKPADRVSPAKVPLPPYIPDTPVTRNDWARMYTAIEEMDFQAGQILHQLDADGLSSNTIVFFFSDHGQGLPRGKRWLYDQGLHVPLIIRWPGHINPKTRDGNLVSFVDFAPTILSLAGVSPVDSMQGQIFLGDQKAASRKYIFATRDRMDEAFDMARAVRDARYEYIRNFYPEIPRDLTIKYMEQIPTMKELHRLHDAGQLSGPATWFFQKPKPAEEFYDTLNDPFELHNLADDPAQAERINNMRNVLTAWQIKIGDKGFEPEPPGNVFNGAKRRRKARANRK